MSGTARCVRNIAGSLIKKVESRLGETDTLKSDCDIRKVYTLDA